MGELVIGVPGPIEGFEHGLLSSAGGFICGSISANNGATIAIDSAVKNSGAYSLKSTQSNGSNQNSYISYTQVMTNGSLSGHFKIRKSANPTVRTPIFDMYLVNDVLHLFLEADGSLTLEFDNDLTQKAVNVQGALANDVFHTICVALNSSSTTWIAYLTVNGVDAVSTAVSNVSGAAQLSASVLIGSNTVGAAAKGTFSLWFDDVIFTDDVNDHPIGNYNVMGYQVNGVGTHNLDATPSLHFFKHDNTTRTALTTAETTSHQMIDELPFATAVADRIQVERVVSTPTLPTFVAAGTVNSGTAGVAPGVPAGTADGDVLIITVESENETAATLSGGNQTWTEIGGAGGIGTGVGSATDATRIQAFWARRGATAPTMPTTSDTGDHQQVRCTAWRNVYSQGDPIGGSATSVEAGNLDATGSATGFTTLTANEMVLIAVGTALPDTADTGIQFSAWANANLGTVTERTDNTTAAGTGGGMGLCSGSKAAAGAIGATTFTTAQSTAKAMLVFSLKGSVTITYPANTKYAEYTLADSAESVAPDVVGAMVALSAEGSLNTFVAVKIHDGTASATVFNAGVNGATMVFVGSTFSVAPSGVAWTDALFDALKVQIGFTNSVDEIVHVENVIVQAAFPVSSATTYQKTGSITAGASSTGADASTRGRAGSILTTTQPSGADAFQPSETGSLRASALVSGASAKEKPRTGALIATGLLAGADASTRAETGALVALAVLAGVDVAEHPETGSLVATARLEGPDATTRAETGALIAAALLSGSRIREFAPRAGSVIASGRLSAADVAEHSELGSLIASAIMAGADVSERAEAGSLVAGTILSGADASEHSEAGTILAQAFLSAIDASTFAEAGSLRASALTSGADTATLSRTGSILATAKAFGVAVKQGAGKAGSIIAGALMSGGDSSQRAETGSLLVSALSSGTKSQERSKTGSVTAGTNLSGADAAAFAEAGFLAAKGFLAGADAATMNEVGSLIAKALLSGVSQKAAASKPGTIMAGGSLSGAKTTVYGESGFLAAKTFGAGVKSTTVTKTGVLLAGGKLYGADVFIATRTGALVAVGSITAVKQKEYAKAGSIVARALLSGLAEILTGFYMDGTELHFLTAAQIQEAVLTNTGTEGAELTGAEAVIYAQLTAAGMDEIVIIATIPEKGKLTKVGFDGES